MQNRGNTSAPTDSGAERRLHINGKMFGQRMRRPTEPVVRPERPSVVPQQPQTPPQPVYMTQPAVVTPVPPIEQVAPQQQPVPIPQHLVVPGAPAATTPVTPVMAAPQPLQLPQTPKTQKRRSRLPIKRLVAGFALVSLMAAGAYGYLFVYQPPSNVPANIDKQVNFGILTHSNDTVVDVNQISFRFDARLGVLSYSGQLANGSKISFTEQATPKNFSSNPAEYKKLVDSLNPYGKFESKNGTYYLLKPTQLKGGQSAVINSQGTLLFALPGDTLTQAQWQAIFDDLRYYRQK